MMPGDLVPEDVVVLHLRLACEAAGGQKAWAAAHHVSASYVNDVLQARRAPGDAILRALGFARVICYRGRPAAADARAVSDAKNGEA